MRHKLLGIVVAVLLAGCTYTMITPDQPPVDCSQNLRETEVWLDRHVAKEMGRKLPVRKRDVPVIAAAAAGDIVVFVGATSLYVAASVVAAVGESNTDSAAGLALTVGGRAAEAALERAVQEASEMPLENEAQVYVFNSRSFERDRFAKKWQGVADCHLRAGEWAEAIRVYENIVVYADDLQVRPLLDMKSVYGHLADSYSKLGMPAEAEIYRTRQSGEQ